MNAEIVYLLRKTNLTLREIGKLTPAQFNEIIKEASYQEGVDEYRRQHSIASLLAAIYNTIPRKRGSKVFKASDFLAEMPARNPKSPSTLDELANKHNIKPPTKELRSR